MFHGIESAHKFLRLLSLATEETRGPKHNPANWRAMRGEIFHTSAAWILAIMPHPERVRLPK